MNLRHGLKHILVGTRDLLDPGIRGTPTNTPLRLNNDKGQYWDFTAASSEYVDFGDASRLFGTTGTFMVKHRVPTGAGGSFPFSTRTSTSSVGIDCLYGAGSTSMSLRLYQSGGANIPSADVDISGHLDDWIYTFGAYDISGLTDAADCAVFDENGQLIGQATNTPTGNMTALTHAQNFRFANRGTNYYDGDVEFVLIYDRVLSFAERQALARNPYQIFPARDVLVPLTPAEEVTEEVTGDTNVSAGTANLTLTTYAATIAKAVNVEASTAALTLTTQQATVSLDIDIDATTAGLTLATYQAGVALDIDIQATTAALTLATYQANITAPAGDTDVDATVVNLTLTTQQATVSLDIDVQASTAALTLSTFAASIANDVTVSATTAALSLATQPATITYDVNVNASVAALTLTTYPASIISGTNVEANTASLTLTTHQATLSYDRNIECSAEVLNLNTYRATIFPTSEVEEEEQPSGGYGAYNAYSAYRQRRRKRERERKRLLELAQKIDDPIDREIAETMQRQLAYEERTEEIERLKQTVIDREFTESRARLFNEKVAKAYTRAVTQANFSAIEAFEREMEKSLEEEEFFLMAVMMLE